MRIVLLALSLVMVSWAQEKPESMIRFSNEDQLTGTLESLSMENVVWISPIQTKPTAFLTREVLDLSLPGQMPPLKSSHEATLRLARGDSVKGEIASVSDESVELDTWYAGRMKFPRVMVRDISIADRPHLLFRGPTSLEGWTQSTEPTPWSYRDGAFRSQEPGSIARDLELPDGFSLSFDVAWRNLVQFSVVVYSDDPSTEQPENGYVFEFRGRSIQLRRLGGGGNLMQPQAAVMDFQQNEKAKVEIRASSRTKNLSLYVNGRIIEVWNDPAMNPELLGKAIHFVSHDNGRLKISGIEVSEWDGIQDETPPVGNAMGNRFRNLDVNGEEVEGKPAKDRSLEGRMLLRNGDSVAGEVLSISDGMITLKTSYDEIKLPVSRFRAIALKPVSLEEPKRMNGDVRGWMVDGTSLVFRLEDFGKDRIRGFSQNFGAVDFDLKAFTRLEFNIYNPALEQLRRKDEW